MHHFKTSEFDCKCGCGKNNIHPEFVNMLETARTWAGIAFVVNSGCRCESHNRKVGGKPDSAHLDGLAADIRANNNWYRYKILGALFRAGFQRILINRDFIHVDVDSNKPIDIVYLYEVD